MKKIKIFLILFVMLSFLLPSTMIVFADENENSTQVTVNVKAGIVFVNEYDHTSITMQVEVGKTMNELPHKDIDGYTFDGWYLGDNYWNFETDIVKENISLHARYIKNTSKDDNVVIGVVNNNENINDVKLNEISKKEALIIVDKFNDIKKAINEDKEVIIFADVKELNDEGIIETIGVSSKKAVIFNINLYAQIVGDPSSKKQITDTNGYKTNVLVSLTPKQVSKIEISSKKDYFVIIDKNGSFESNSVSIKKVNGNFVFSFETSKFPAYAIYSEDKKPDPHIIVPDTGVIGLLTNNTSSSNIFILILIGLLVCALVIVDKKNKNKQ